MSKDCGFSRGLFCGQEVPAPKGEWLCGSHQGHQCPCSLQNKSQNDKALAWINPNAIALPSTPCHAGETPFAEQVARLAFFALKVVQRTPPAPPVPGKIRKINLF
jgi:hypothetical protein